MLLARPPHPPLCQLPWLVHYTYCTSSSVPDVNYRCSQASSAFKTTLFSDIPHFSKIEAPGHPDCIHSHLRLRIPSLPRPLLMYSLVDSHLRFSHQIPWTHYPPPDLCWIPHLRKNNSLSLRTISSPFRRGAPRAHWPEIALAESAHRLQHLRQKTSCIRTFSPPILYPYPFHHCRAQDILCCQHETMV